MLTIDELIELDRKDDLAVSKDEGLILMQLVRDLNPKVIVEVGTGNGYSTSWMYHGMDEGATIYTIDKEIRNHIFTPNGRIKFFEGKLVDIIDQLPEEIDLAFLDTEHLIYKVIPDIDLLVPRMKTGSVIAIHDTSYRTVLGGCLKDYFAGIDSDRMKEEKVSPSKLKWKYRTEDTEYGIGIATLRRGKRGK